VSYSSARDPNSIIQGRTPPRNPARVAEYQFEIIPAPPFCRKLMDPRPEEAIKMFANHLQKCPVAVEFGVPKMQLSVRDVRL
jgi:hypothetical protein